MSFVWGQLNDLRIITQLNLGAMLTARGAEDLRNSISPFGCRFVEYILEDDQYEAVRRHRPDYAQPVVTFASITGWRVRSEVLTLQWRQVDFKAGIVRLDPGTTKNLEGRVFVMTPELRATLEAQRAVTEALQQTTGRVIPWVFHRTQRGRPLKGFRRAWLRACLAAGVPGRILHGKQTRFCRHLTETSLPVLSTLSLFITCRKRRARRVRGKKRLAQDGVASATTSARPSRRTDPVRTACHCQEIRTSPLSRSRLTEWRVFSVCLRPTF